MTAFRYQALSASGQEDQGVVHADSAKAARQWLRQQGLTPLEVKSIDAQSPSGQPRARRRVFSLAERGMLTRQLAGLINAGLPLERALAALSDEARKTTHIDILNRIRSEVQGGSALAAALAQHPKDFPSEFCAVVAAAEQSGRLGHVLDRLANEMEAAEQLKGKLLGAALYPMIVTGVAIVMVIFLMAYVVPQVASVFAAREQALPWLTRALLAMSQGVQSHGWAAAIAMGLGIGFFMLLYRKPDWRTRIDAWLLRTPLFGPLLLDYHNARLAATLSLLSGAGLPILKAIKAASETVTNHGLKRDVDLAHDLVREGASLAAALDAQTHCARWLIVFARLGEQTGQLSEMLGRAAQQSADRVQRKALALATWLEPLLILLMGLMVLAIVMSILLPIMELNSFATV